MPFSSRKNSNNRPRLSDHADAGNAEPQAAPAVYCRRRHHLLRSQLGRVMCINRHTSLAPFRLRRRRIHVLLLTGLMAFRSGAEFRRVHAGNLFDVAPSRLPAHQTISHPGSTAARGYKRRWPSGLPASLAMSNLSLRRIRGSSRRKNIRWALSSSALHGMTVAVSGRGWGSCRRRLPHANGTVCNRSCSGHARAQALLWSQAMGTCRPAVH